MLNVLYVDIRTIEQSNQKNWKQTSLLKLAGIVIVSFQTLIPNYLGLSKFLLISKLRSSIYETTATPKENKNLITCHSNFGWPPFFSLPTNPHRNEAKLPGFLSSDHWFSVDQWPIFKSREPIPSMKASLPFSLRPSAFSNSNFFLEFHMLHSLVSWKLKHYPATPF